MILLLCLAFHGIHFSGQNFQLCLKRFDLCVSLTDLLLSLTSHLLQLMLNFLKLCLASESRLDLIIDHLLIHLPGLSAHQLVLRQGLDIIDADTFFDVPIREEDAHQNVLDLLLVLLVK